jgi:predicted acyl esterase
VALADFKGHFWRTAPIKYTGTSNPVKVGLGANASDHEGVFWFAVIGYGGQAVEVTSIEMNYPDSPLLGYPIDYEQFIEAKDGTQLATNVFLPLMKDPGPIPQPPYPIVLMRTPYNKDVILDTEIEGTKIAKFLADLNVMFVIQYFRGRRNDTGAWPDSGGTESLFRDHAGPDDFDAINTVEWIEARNFYNGDLALTGPSALGLWIYQAAPTLGNRVAAMYPQASAADVGDWAARRNGCFKLSNLTGWINIHEYPSELLDEAKDNIDVHSYWNAVDFDTKAGMVRSPGYHETGWWDVDVEATIYSWRQLQHNGGSGASGEQKLVIGPWSHDSFRESQVGEITFPVAPADNDATSVPVEWDGAYWLLSKIGRNPFFSPPEHHVRYYMMGEEGLADSLNNRWFTAPDWPPAYSDSVFHLDGTDGGLKASMPSAGTAAYSAVLFPALLSVGGANLPEFGLGTGSYDQSEIELDDNVLTFRTAELGDALPIAGPARIKLFFELTDETEAVDTDIMVKLIDEYPDGRNMLVADTAMRLSWYLDNFTAHTGVTPGEVYELDFEIGQRAYVFESGHKIGIDIQGTNSPRFELNPGNGDALPGGDSVDQNCVIHFGGANDSQLILPEFDPTG